MDVSYLETITLSHLPEEATEMAHDPSMAASGLEIEIPEVLNEEQKAIFFEVGQVTLYHP